MDPKITSQQIQDLFKHKKVYTSKEIKEKFACSHQCFWNSMRKLEYFNSFSHNSKFFTLSTNLDFDENGVCFIDEPNIGTIGFTKHKTSKKLIVSLIDSCEHGLTEKDLNELINIRVSNQLNVLTSEGKIRKEKNENGKYQYFSGDAGIYKEQHIKFTNENAPKKVNQDKGDDDTITAIVKKYKTQIEKITKSRDNWRERSTNYRYTIKLMSLRVRDLTKSRDLWKQHSKDYKERNIQLESELNDIKKNSGAK